jgi:hypothetical protein
MIQFVKKNKYLILFFVFLSLQVSSFSIFSVSNFESLNTPVYDGVMYDYQQIKRYDKFHGDFSLINRFSQSIYEFKGNATSGLYSALITFLAPSFLISKWDLFIRSFIGVLLFSLSYYLYFKEYWHKNWVLLSLGIFFQLPLFYHYRTGLGSSVPELVSAVYLMSGYLLILYGIYQLKINYLAFGLLAMLFAVFFRFNFFVYLVLLSPSLLFGLFNNWKFFSLKQRKRTFLIIFLFLLVFVSYISIYFASFLNYYTKGSYAFTTISLSLSFMFEIFTEYFGYVGLFILLIISVGNSIFSWNTQYNFMNKKLLLLFPFIVFFLFIVIYLKSTNVPHIMSIMALFLALFIISRKFPIYFKEKKWAIYLMIVLYTIVFSANGYTIYHQKNTDQYKAQNEVIAYVEKRLFNNQRVKFRCFFDSGIEIPIIVALYNRKKILHPLEGGFNVQDVFYPKSIDFHTSEYISNIQSTDLVIINSHKSRGLQMGEKAMMIQNNLRKYLLENPDYKVVKVFSSSFYSNLLVFQRLKN